LGASDTPLVEAYDLAMLDLDGVVYIGGEAVPGAAQHLARVREQGMRLAYVTNNASRPPDAVASHLRELGVDASTDDVVTSAQAAARLLRERYGDGARVALLGGPGLDAALRAEGLEPVSVDDEQAAAVVSGYGPEVLWRDIMRVAVRVKDGLPWVASNTDLTIPTPFGTAPGHGVLVGVLRDFAGIEPEVAGKPARPLLDETIRRVGGEHPLMVGDRLDTDIDGAVNAGCDSLLVMTGVTGSAELGAAPAGRRPTYVAADLGGLLEAQGAVDVDGVTARLGGWTAAVTDGTLGVEGQGSADDWWRVVAASAWAFLDSHGDAADTGQLEPPSAGSGEARG
jgi:HAD superfamily hydrolase (TIGR01450 family)